MSKGRKLNKKHPKKINKPSNKNLNHDFQQDGKQELKQDLKQDLNSSNSLLKSLNKKIDDMSLKMEKMKFVDYVYYIEHPRKMLRANFLNGLARGFGIAIGFTLLGAIAVYILNKIVQINLPYIGEFISEIVRIVESSRTR